MRKSHGVLSLVIIALLLLLSYQDRQYFLEKQYSLLSPHILTQKENDVLVNFVDLREKIKSYLQADINQDTGFYFEYLPSGVSIGVNDQKEFISASLLKVPTVMAIYDQIEHNKLSKTTVLTLKQDAIDRGYGTFWKHGIGAQLTVEEAIQHTLIESDNTTNRMLYNILPPIAVSNVFDYLDIPKDFTGDRPVVSAKNYSSILRSLYLSSFLPKNLSQEILDTLTRSIATDKIVAGVPKGILIAHKIGVYADTNIYSDCGIVYVPKRPYIICLMTKAASEDLAGQQMRYISSLVYNYVVKSNDGDMINPFHN